VICLLWQAIAAACAKPKKTSHCLPENHPDLQHFCRHLSGKTHSHLRLKNKKSRHCSRNKMFIFGKLNATA